MTEIPEHLRRRAEEARQLPKPHIVVDSPRPPYVDPSTASSGGDDGSATIPPSSEPTRGEREGRAAKLTLTLYLIVTALNLVKDIVHNTIFTGHYSVSEAFIVGHLDGSSWIHWLIVWSGVYAALYIFTHPRRLIDRLNDAPSFIQGCLQLLLVILTMLWLRSLIWASLDILWPGYGHSQNRVRLFTQSMMDGSGWIFWLGVLLLIAAVTYALTKESVSWRNRPAIGDVPWITLDKSFSNPMIALLLALGLIITIAWTPVVHGRIEPIHNASAFIDHTVVAIEDDSVLEASDGNPATVPESLTLMFEDSTYDSDGNWICAHDPCGKYTVQTPPSEGWAIRWAGPLLGSSRVLQEDSGTASGTELLTDTMAYIYYPSPALEPLENESDGERAIREREAAIGMWSGIRDGDGWEKPIESVVMWDGRSESPQVCEFSGANELHASLRGSRANSLLNELFTEYAKRGLTFHQSDIFGYCEGDDLSTPIIIVPVLRLHDTGMGVIEMPAGVISIHGSPSGDARMEYFDHVEPGQFLGPVYPASVVANHRAASGLLAGRRHNDQNDFGFEAANFPGQDGNASEFHVLSLDDGRTYYVTPETPRNSDNEKVIAFSVVAADSVTDGELNRLTIYALNDKLPGTQQPNPAVATINLMDQALQEELLETQPTFVTNGGECREFIPGPGTTFVAQCTLNGRPSRVAIVDYVGGSIEFQETFAAGFANVTDGADLTGLTDDRLREELDKLLDEAAERDIGLATTANG